MALQAQAVRARVRGLHPEINGQHVSVRRFDPVTDKYDVVATFGQRFIKAEYVEILSQWCGRRIYVRGVARLDLNEKIAFAITELDAEGKVVVAMVEDDDSKNVLFRMREENLRLLPHMPPADETVPAHFYNICRQDWGGSNPQEMYDLFGVPSEDAPTHGQLTDFWQPPSEKEIRAYFGDRVYQGLEMAEFELLAQHNFVEYSFGRRGRKSNNDHTYFLTDGILRGVIYMAGRGEAIHEIFSERSQLVPVTSDTAHDGQWYPVIAVQIKETKSTPEIIKWRCPAIGAWGSRTWASSSDRFVAISSSRLSAWLAVARSRSPELRC